MLYSFVHYDRARALGNAVGAAIDQYGETGKHPIENDDVRDMFIKALAPKNVGRAVSVTQNNAVKSLNTGNQLTGELNTAEIMLYNMGFNPRRLALAHEVNEKLWTDQKKYKAKMQTMAKAWIEAKEEKDWDALQELQVKALRDGIDLSSILRSVKTREHSRNNARYDVRYKPEDVAPFKALGLIE